MSKQSKLNAGGASRLHGGVSNIPLYAGMLQGRPFRGLLHEVAEFGLPSNGLLPIVNRWRFHNFKNLWRGLYKVLLLDAAGLPGIFGKLSLAGYIGAGGLWLPFGLASMRVVTTAGVNYLVDALQNLVEPENLRYHALGTGAGAEAAGETALVTELTTEYNPDSTRATGSLTEGASANIFRTVGTNTLDSGTPSIVEHGVFNQAAAGGTLLDRSTFTAIALDGTNGDGLQSTYDLTLTAGS